MILALATILTWATWGLNLAIILLVQSGVNSLGGSVWGVSGSSASFQWGAVMPLSLIAAVSTTSLLNVQDVSLTLVQQILLSVATVFSALSFFSTTRSQSQKHGSGFEGEKRLGRGSTSSSY